MPYGTFETRAQSRTVSVDFINTKAPTAPGNGTGYTQTSISSGTFPVSIATRTGGLTPGFNSPNRKTLLLPLDFFYQVDRKTQHGQTRIRTSTSDWRNGPGSNAYQSSDTETYNTFPVAFATDDTSSWTTRMATKATRNLLKNLKDSSFNAAVAVGERKQTCNLVATTATRVAKSLLSLKRGNFKGAAQALGVLPKKRAGRRFSKEYPKDQAKAIGNAWLELQYGWKPLLSDVYGAAEALAKANSPSGNPNTIYQKAKGRAKWSGGTSVKTDLLQPPATGYDFQIVKGLGQVDVTVSVTYSISSPAPKSLASLGITNPLLLAWELMPYSFVVDWFLPIGNWLESLDATLGLTFHSGYRTTVRRFNSSAEWYTQLQHGPAKIYSTSKIDIANWERIVVTRTALGSFPSAPFPSFKNPISTGHVANAMALLLQLKR